MIDGSGGLESRCVSNPHPDLKSLWELAVTCANCLIMHGAVTNRNRRTCLASRTAVGPAARGPEVGGGL